MSKGFSVAAKCCGDWHVAALMEFIGKVQIKFVIFISVHFPGRSRCSMQYTMAIDQIMLGLSLLCCTQGVRIDEPIMISRMDANLELCHIFIFSLCQDFDDGCDLLCGKFIPRPPDLTPGDRNANADRFSAMQQFQDRFDARPKSTLWDVSNTQRQFSSKRERTIDYWSLAGSGQPGKVNPDRPKMKVCNCGISKVFSLVVKEIVVKGSAKSSAMLSI